MKTNYSILLISLLLIASQGYTQITDDWDSALALYS